MKMNELEIDIDGLGIVEGTIFPSYAKMCRKFGVEPVKGKGRMYQEQEIRRFFDYDKVDGSQKLVVTKIHDKPKTRIDVRYNITNNNTYDLDTYDYGVGTTNNGDKFYFDKDDYDKIKDYCWKQRLGYLEAYISKDNKIRMHRLIMDVTDRKYVVDHINHNRADNRKCNLKICTQKENMITMHQRK